MPCSPGPRLGAIVEARKLADPTAHASMRRAFEQDFPYPTTRRPMHNPQLAVWIGVKLQPHWPLCQTRPAARHDGSARTQEGPQRPPRAARQGALAGSSPATRAASPMPATTPGRRGCRLSWTACPFDRRGQSVHSLTCPPIDPSEPRGLDARPSDSELEGGLGNDAVATVLASFIQAGQASISRCVCAIRCKNHSRE